MARHGYGLWLVVLCAWGCARLPTQAKSNKLPPARLAPDAVVLDVAFVKLPAADQASYEAIWLAADEQAFSPELRRDLAQNGIRVGLYGQELPPRLRELLDAEPTSLEERSEDVTAADAEVSGSKRRLTVRAGRRAKILASKTFASLPVLITEDGQVRGHSLSQAQCLLAVKPHPLGDSRAKVELTPEIEHGEMKTQWVGSEGSLMPRVGRERLVVDRLRIDATLAPGQWLVLSSTPDIIGLGEHFFAEMRGGAPERTLVVVRLAQTQIDDLFAPEQSAVPLATPVE